MNHFEEKKSYNSSKIEAGSTGTSATRVLFDYQSPFRLVALIALSVFIGESIVMIVLSFMQPSSVLLHAFFDSTIFYNQV